MEAPVTHWTLDLELPSLQNNKKETSVLCTIYSFWCSIIEAQDRTPLLSMYLRSQKIEDNVEAVLGEKTDTSVVECHDL